MPPRRKLWGELAKVGSFEAQAAARAQLGEVEPAIRYCSYRLGRADGASAAELAGDLPPGGGDLLGVRIRWLLPVVTLVGHTQALLPSPCMKGCAPLMVCLSTKQLYDLALPQAVAYAPVQIAPQTA